MVERQELPLVFLYTQRRHAIEGGTRFQKLVFLAQEEHGLDKSYEYEADQFGPFSAELYHDLDRLEAEGLVEKEEVSLPGGKTRYDFRITQSGIEHIKGLLEERGGNAVFEAVQGCKEKFNDWPLPKLLRYVYNRYGEYKEESNLTESDLEDPEPLFQRVEPEELPALEDEPEAGIHQAAETPEWEVIQPHVLKEYLDQVRDIQVVIEVYLEERENDRDRIVTVLSGLDMKAMDRIYDIERELRREFEYPEVSFEIVPASAARSPVPDKAEQLL